MAFKYINPGYAALLENNNKAEQISGTVYSKTGVSFYHVPVNSTITSIDVFTKILTSDLYFRSDIYYQGGNHDLHCISSYSENIDYSHGFASIKNSLYIKYRGNILGDALPLKKNSINRIWLHLHFSGSADTSYGELKVNDATSYVSFAKRNYYGFTTSQTPIKIYSYNRNASNYLSNIIISDEYISPNEQAGILPPLATETNMMAGANGIYTANVSNQTLLQSIDVEELIKNYGASAAITAFEVVGNPAYKIGGSSASLIGLSKIDESIAEHGTVSLSSDTDAVIYDSWSTENLPVASLNSMSFGWKVGT